MIIGTLVNLFIMVIGMVNKVMPDWILPDPVCNALATIISYSYLWDGIIPIYDILYVISFVMVMEAGIFLFRLIGGMISLIRGGGNIDI